LVSYSGELLESVVQDKDFRPPFTMIGNGEKLPEVTNPTISGPLNIHRVDLDAQSALVEIPSRI